MFSIKAIKHWEIVAEQARSRNIRAENTFHFIPEHQNCQTTRTFAFIFNLYAAY
jgi:hypothetical protein